MHNQGCMNNSNGDQATDYLLKAEPFRFTDKQYLPCAGSLSLKR